MASLPFTGSLALVSRYFVTSRITSERPANGQQLSTTYPIILRYKTANYKFQKGHNDFKVACKKTIKKLSTAH